MLTGRITGLPFNTEDISNLLHLAIAGRYSNAREGIRYDATTEIYMGPGMPDTELFEAEGAFTLDYELAWQKGPFLLSGEYLVSYVNGSASNDPTYDGYYIAASYFLTGEMREYNRRGGAFRKIPVAKGVNAGGWGSWDVYARWSQLDLKDEIADGGKMGTVSTGVNGWATSSIFANINYRYSMLDRFGEVGKNHGLVVRLGFILD